MTDDLGHSDEALMAAYRGGEAAAFEELVRRYVGELYGFLARFVGDRALAEDLVQETFLQVHVSAGAFDTAQRFRPWLFTIAANKARDRLRRQGRRWTVSLDSQAGTGEEAVSLVDLLAAEGSPPEEALEGDELRAAVRRIVGHMPDHLREVLVMCYFHHFSYKEVAGMLNVPLGTVKSRLHAAVADFARRWRQLDRMPPEGA